MLKRSTVGIVLVVLVAVSLLFAWNAYAGCTEYHNSKKTWVPFYGWSCAGSGSGCTECSDPVSGSSCVFDGYGSCDWTPENQY